MSTSNKILVVVVLLVAVYNFIEFVFFGQAFRSLVAATGFIMMAFGTYKNANLLRILGCTLGLAAILAKYIA